ncbi:MAG: hypothetical protein Q8896_12690, partial [Bacteroidota bacterium]|nr:hypothetical protein [Bacteroidota bacterium]
MFFKHLSSVRSTKERGIRLTILTGFGLVILLSLFIAGWTYYHITSLGNAADNLFIANYRSIQYVHSMEGVLDSYTNSLIGNGSNVQTLSSLDKVFRDNLTLEYHNITEKGESETAHAVEKSYNILLARLAKTNTALQEIPSKESILRDIETVKANCEALLILNERAMFARADATKGDAEFARTSSLIIICLLIGASVVLALGVSRRSLAEFRQLDRAKSN